MESTVTKSSQLKRKRAIRVRKHLRGTKDRPRLCVIKSNLHIEAQLIDDETGFTIASMTTKSKEAKEAGFGRKGKESAAFIGKQIAVLAKKQQIERVVFDRGPSKYHGVLAALADAARAEGLQL